MKIKEISFKNTAIPPWELKKMNFSDLTLLVGASGVGKTQILNSLMKLINISNGYVYNGVEWDLHFTGDNDENYRWTGQFENVKEIHTQYFEEKDIDGQRFIPKLLKEELFLENKLVFTREESNVKYEGKESPKISSSKSVLNLFTTEEKISPVKKALGKIVFLDYQTEKKFEIPTNLTEELEKQVKGLLQNVEKVLQIEKIQLKDFDKESADNSFKSEPQKKSSLEEEILFKVFNTASGKNLLESILKKIPLIMKKTLSELAKLVAGTILPESIIKDMAPRDIFLLGFIMEFKILKVKLFLTQHYFKGIFEKIVADFKDIFPQVEDIRFQLLKSKEIYELQIKERGTDWIRLQEISSGMFKTLMHLVEIKLMADGSVILVDEFENSLGVNCIDAVADSLLNPDRKLQYIITSHHPYIINNINMKYWKIVMRKGSKVFTKNADELKLGKSKHDAFKQLLNLEAFSEGIN